MKKVLLISLGSIGKRHLRNTRDLLPDAKIAVYRQHTSGSEVPEHADLIFTSLEDAVAFAPDVVLNSSPASEHYKTSDPFLKKNIPIFVEKPLTADYPSAHNFLKAVKASKGFSFVGYVLRFQPIFSFLREFINKPNCPLGKILTARIEVGQYLPDWRPDSDYRMGVSAQRKLGGGVLLELSHELDYTTWLFGYPKSLVCSCAHISDLDLDVEDTAHVIFEYNEKRIAIQLDFLQRKANMAMQIVGEKATLYADFIKEEVFINDEQLGVPKLKNGNEMYLRQFDFFFSNIFSDYLPRFLESKEYTGFASVDASEKVMKIIDAAKLSNIEGRRIDLNL